MFDLTKNSNTMSVSRRGNNHAGAFYRGRQLVQASRFALSHAAPHVARAVGSHVKQSAYNYVKKKWNGHTKTKPVVRENHAAAASHSGVAQSTISLGNWKPPKYGKRMTPKGRFKYQQDYKGITGGVAGKQTVTDFTFPNTFDKCLTSTGGGYSTTQNNLSLASINPSAANTGSSYFPVIQQPDNNKFVIISNTLEIEMTSLSNTGTYVDIYICKAKKWASKIPGDVWGDAAISQAFGNAASAQPVTPLLAGTIGYPIITEVGNKPGAFKLFSQFWETKKVIPLEFTPGSTEKLTIHIGINKIIDVAKLKEMRASTNPIFIPGVSYSLFFIQRGAINIDITGGIRESTYGGTEVAWIVQEKTLMRDVEQAASRFDTSVLYSNITTGAATPFQKLVNEIDTVGPPVVA